MTFYVVYDEVLVQTKNFVYLESIISDIARLDSELTFQTGKASAICGSCGKGCMTAIMCPYG